MSLVGSASDAIDDVTGVLDSIPERRRRCPSAARSRRPASAGESLVARDNFAAALERMGGEGSARR